MSLSNLLSTYNDCIELFERALSNAPDARPGAEAGARGLCGTRDKAFYTRMRMNQARALLRDESKRIYPKDDPRWGKSEFDNLRCTLREDTLGQWWIYVIPYGTDFLEIEDILPEPTDEPKPAIRSIQSSPIGGDRVGDLD